MQWVSWIGGDLVAIPRAMMRHMPWMADPAMYLKRHLVRFAGMFGEAPRIAVAPCRVV